MGDTYQIAKENDHCWYLKTTRNGVNTTCEIFESKRKAQAALMNLILFQMKQMNFHSELS